ncbi:type II toxin-antitoxin system antitoxin SocA domain-containing protein [Thioalkalivibrio sp. HK1]|uniref:type II toxin-antitoxin system antitoxin SocA domain-containing protein n=1 Tax=Thioalkalivibrio sp. HK1 TaxID=1469245 RepID=UPI0009DF78EF|nr:type II toxin-antitoxin system antitoxin SocA domain-containing protein [Thioalkalivibrio sp. HK1]
MTNETSEGFDYVPMTMTTVPIKFRFPPKKCLQAVQWMPATANEPLGFQTIFKTAYFADKRMLSIHWRPIFGDIYHAMDYGPMPVKIDEILRCEPYYLSELELDDYPWERKGYRVSLIDPSHSSEILNPTSISITEMDFLTEEFERCREMKFDKKTKETHQRDWVNGFYRLDNRMDYKDMIDKDHPDREELLQYLNSMGRRLVL